jgi:hypothetical protein
MSWWIELIQALPGLISAIIGAIKGNPPSALASQDEIDAHAVKVAAWEAWLQSMPKL